MKQDDLQILANIYNTLLNIHTAGEDTIMMADSMRALKNFILEKDIELKNNKEE